MVILGPHPVKPANIADKDENGEKGDPIYQGVVFGTTKMPLKMKNVLKKIFEETKILEAWPVGTTTPTTEASIQITGEPPSSLPYRRSEGDREITRTLVQDLIEKSLGKCMNLLARMHRQCTYLRRELSFDLLLTTVS